MSNPTFYKANNLHLLIEDLTKDDADKFETPLYQFEYAAKIAEWSVDEYEKANLRYQFTDLEKSALAINALSKSNSELFIYLYKQGHAKTSPPSDPLLTLKQTYSSEVITTPKKLTAYLEAGGSVFDTVELDAKNGFVYERCIMDILSREKATFILESVSRKWYFHIYMSGCFDENNDFIKKHLDLFNFHFLPHLFEYKTIPLTYPLEVELFQEMCDHHPLPLGWACALLSQLAGAATNPLFYENPINKDTINPRQYFTDILKVFLNHVREPFSMSEEPLKREPTEKALYWEQMKKENETSYTESDEIALLELMFSHFSKEDVFAKTSSKEFVEKFKYYHKTLGPKISVMCTPQSARLALGGMLTYSLLNYPTREFEQHPIRQIKWKFIGSEWTERSFEYFSHSMNRYDYEPFDFEHVPTQPLNPNYLKYMVEMANILIYKSTNLNKEQARQCEGFIVHGLSNENIEDIPLLPRSIVSFMRYVDQNKEIKDYVQKNINPQYSNHLMIQQMLKSQLMTTIQQVKEEPKLHLFHGTQRF